MKRFTLAGRNEIRHFLFTFFIVLLIGIGCKKNSDIQKVPQIENISLSELLQWNTWLQKTMPNPPVLMFNKAEKTFVGNTFFVKVPIKGSTGMLYFAKGKSLEVVFIRQLSSENVKDAPYTGDYEVIDFNVFTQRIFSFNKGRIVSSKKVKILGSQSSGTSGYTTNRSWFGQLLYCLGHYILAVPKRDANGEWSECWGIGGGDGSSGGEQGTVQDMQPDIGGGGGINWATFLATVIVPTNGNEPDPLPFESMPGGGGNYTWVPFTPPSGSGSYVGIIGSNYEQLNDLLIENEIVDEDLDSDEENTADNGPTQVMPSSLTLSNGSVITITFGVTTSDGQNAQKAVSVRLIEAIKTALEIANKKVSITSIHIFATTNGTHATTSNHYRGLAIDISKINGIPVSIMGANNIVTELQKAIEETPNRRENFGPALKLKLGPPFAIGGHGDHIHFAINGL